MIGSFKRVSISTYINGGTSKVPILKKMGPVSKDQPPKYGTRLEYISWGTFCNLLEAVYENLDTTLLVLFKIVSSDILMLDNVSNGCLKAFLATSAISIILLLEF